MYFFYYLEPVCCSLSSSVIPVVHTYFSGGRSGGLVFPSLEEFSTVYCDPHSQSFGIVNKAEVEVFLELSCFFSFTSHTGKGDMGEGKKSPVLKLCL